METELQAPGGDTQVSPKPRATPVASSSPTHRVEVGDDLVEEPQALDAPVVDALLRVEVGEVGEGGEHDADLVVGLAVQLLGMGKGGGREPGMRLHLQQTQTLLQSTTRLSFPWACAKKNEGALQSPFCMAKK